MDQAGVREIQGSGGLLYAKGRSLAVTEKRHRLSLKYEINCNGLKALQKNNTTPCCPDTHYDLVPPPKTERDVFLFGTPRFESRPVNRLA